MATDYAIRYAPAPAVNRAAQVLGLVALVSSKTADVVTTLVLLESGRVFESQTVPAAAIDALGTLPALLVLSAVALAFVIVPVEAGVWFLRRRDFGYAIAFVRVFGYGPVSLMWFYVATQNAAIAPVVFA